MQNNLITNYESDLYYSANINYNNLFVRVTILAYYTLISRYITVIPILSFSITSNLLGNNLVIFSCLFEVSDIQFWDSK